MTYKESRHLWHLAHKAEKKAYDAEYRQSHKKERAENALKHKDTQALRHLRHVLKARYGLTVADYERMLEEQRGVCAICGNEMDPPCVDHDHATGKVRGLLCKSCNWILGRAKDNPDIFRRAILYLE
jgi:hypothetical protein